MANFAKANGIDANSQINKISPSWKDNGDGTWIAKKGASAWSLSKQTGLPPKVCDSIVQSQLRPNYVRESDNMLMSNVEVGDTIRIDSINSNSCIPGNSNIKRDVDLNGSDERQSDSYGINLGPLDYVDEALSGAEKYAQGLKHQGGYVAYSKAKTGKGLYWKPNARGLNNLKGYSMNTSKLIGKSSILTAAALEIPEVYNAYQDNTKEGNKQLAGAGGGVLGGWAGGALTGAGLGLLGFETGPGVILTVIAGADLGAYYGEEGIEKLYDKYINKKDE